MYITVEMIIIYISQNWIKGRKNGGNNMVQIGDRINALNYLFPCNMAATNDPEGIKLFGTGGTYLRCDSVLLGNAISDTD